MITLFGQGGGGSIGGALIKLTSDEDYELYGKDAGLSGVWIQNITYHNGKIYTADFDAGFSVFEGGGTVYFTPGSGATNDVQVLDEERLLVGAGQIYLFENGEFSVFQNSPEGMVSSMVVVSENNIWFSDRNSGIYHWDGSNWNWVVDGIGGSNVYHIALDSSGNIWAAHRNGVSKWDGENWTNYDLISDVVDNAWGVTVDPMNNIWVGTEYGISYFDGESWTSWTTDDGLPGNITNVIAVNPRTGEVISGGYDGMARYLGDIVTTPIKQRSVEKPQNIFVKQIGGKLSASLNLASAGKYRLDVKDIKGRFVESRVFNTEADGYADVVLTHSPTPGVYIAEVLRGNTSVARRKFVF